MNETGREAVPAVGGSSSWADETLPLGLRKELLNRELQKFIAPKASALPPGSAPGLTGREGEDRTGR